MKTVIVTIHGQESNGKKLKELSNRLKTDIKGEVAFVNLRYTRLLTVVNTLPWVRTMTAKYIAARLNGMMHKYPDAGIIVIAHSNGTRATKIAMDNIYNTKKNWPKFRIDGLILLGCVIKRNYDWSNNPHTKVINFVSTNDKVVWLARFYGMGSAGRFGFKKHPGNLTQLYIRWGHSGFMTKYYTLKTAVKFLVHCSDQSQ
jgi:hypothetical protein